MFCIYEVGVYQYFVCIHFMSCISSYIRLLGGNICFRLPPTLTCTRVSGAIRYVPELCYVRYVRYVRYMKDWRFYRWYICFPFVFLLVHHVCHSTTSCVNKLHMQAILDSAPFFIRSGRATPWILQRSNIILIGRFL